MAIDPLTWAGVGAAASLGGAYISSEANKKAAETAAQAQIQAAAMETGAISTAEGLAQQYAGKAGYDVNTGYDTARGEINAGYDAANAAYDAGEASTNAALDTAKAGYGAIAATGAQGPGGDYLRRTVATSGELTPLQKEQLAEIQRQNTNMVRSSAIAGSGRTAAALFRDTSNDFINKSLATNMGRADSAAGTLAGESYGAGMAGAGVDVTRSNLAAALAARRAASNASRGTALGGMDSSRGTALAGIDTSLGNNLATMTQKIGSVNANATTNIGNTNAQQQIATGKVFGQAVGDVGSYIASAGRPSRFSQVGNGGGGAYGDGSSAGGYYGGSPENNPNLAPV